jgi:hypothetical protein
MNVKTFFRRSTVAVATLAAAAIVAPAADARPPSRDATFAVDSCADTNMIGYSLCERYEGNDTRAGYFIDNFLNPSSGTSAFGSTGDWFLADKNDDGNAYSQSVGGFSLGFNGLLSGFNNDASSGEEAKIDFDNVSLSGPDADQNAFSYDGPLVLVLKTATYFSAYKFDDLSQILDIDWDTLGVDINANNGNGRGLSHASLYLTKPGLSVDPLAQPPAEPFDPETEPVVSVPEPSAIAGLLMLTGVLTTGQRRRRRLAAQTAEA